MDYTYWKNKIDRFTRTEITSGFVRSQLVDTQIISKYAYHYLKTVFNKVDVQKGVNTAQFRKIFGIQSKLDKKDRSVHSHHAIDAAVLTLIPPARKREEILKKAYDFEERYRGKQYTEKPFVDFKFSMIQEIEKNILINNIVDKDQTLTPGKKVVRKRGRVVWIDQEKRIMKIAQGDSIRGELHMQTYYGKIKVAEKNKEGSLKYDAEGQIIYNKINGEDEIWMVLRKPIDKVNFKTDIIIDEHLSNHIKSQLASGIKVNELVDFQGKGIRHLRCRVKSGRGFMKPENVTVVKEQTYKSRKEYKNYIYADSGDNYLFGLYENEQGRQIISINKFEASQFISKVSGEFRKEDLFKMKEPVLIKNKEAKLTHVFEVGQKVIFFENKNILNDIRHDAVEISKRLYFVKRLHQASVGNMQFQHHLEARTDDELSRDFPIDEFKSAGKDGFSTFSTEFIAPRLLFKPIKNNFIIEGKDFEMNLDGSIEFKFQE
jgi:CRISPR-associated endonuclease Csn1